MGSSTARVAGTGDGPSLAVVGHVDEIGLIVTHIEDNGFLRFTGVGGWDAQILIGQRVVARHAGRAAARRARQEADPPAEGRGPQEGRRGQGAAHRHRRQGRRRGARAGARRRRRGDRRRTGRAAERARRLALDGQSPRLLRRARGRAARAEAGGAAGDVSACAAVQEEIAFDGARTTAFTACGPRSRSPSTSRTRPTRRASTRPRSGATTSASGPVIERGSTLHPRRSSER